jgi:hypothetical protein
MSLVTFTGATHSARRRPARRSRSSCCRSRPPVCRSWSRCSPACRSSGSGGRRADGFALELVVVPVLAALILVQTIGGDRAVVLDARLPALLVAALLVWRRAPILVIVLAAGATAALLRPAGGSAAGARRPRTREEQVRRRLVSAPYGSASEYAPRPCVAA